MRLIVLKVGCRMSIPISAGVGLEGRVDEQMMGRTDGGRKGGRESEWDERSGRWRDGWMDGWMGGREGGGGIWRIDE